MEECKAARPAEAQHFWANVLHFKENPRNIESGRDA